MYIISVDLGSTNNKAIVLKIENDNIELIGKVKKRSTDFALFIIDILKKYNIEKENIEKIIATGTGASYIEDSIFGVDIIKVNEFDAIGYGGLILAKVYEGIVVSIGTGTSFIYSDLNKCERLGGTGLGGGTLLGLGRKFLKNNKNIDANSTYFLDLIEMAKKGNTKNVDLTIGDINKENIGDLTTDLTAANFAGICKVSNDNDYVAGIVNMLVETISLMAKLHKKILNKNDMPIIIIGTFVADKYIQEKFIKFAEYTKDKYIFINNVEYAISIGAYEYYLLRLRKVD